MAGDSLPAYLRVTVVAGAVTLLIGIAGMLWLPPPLEAAEPARVRLVAADPQIEGLAVEARWNDADGKGRREVGTPCADDLTWVFRDTPSDRPVVLVVTRRFGADDPEQIKYEEGFLRPGAVFELPLE